MSDNIDPKVKRFFPWALFLGLAVLLIVLTFCRPAPAMSWACKPLQKFERTCTGVKAATALMGEARAEALARKCGASDQDIVDAHNCLRPKVLEQCPPVWQCSGMLREADRNPHCCKGGTE